MAAWWCEKHGPCAPKGADGWNCPVCLTERAEKAEQALAEMQKERDRLTGALAMERRNVASLDGDLRSTAARLAAAEAGRREAEASVAWMLASIKGFNEFIDAQHSRASKGYVAAMGRGDKIIEAKLGGESHAFGSVGTWLENHRKKMTASLPASAKAHAERVVKMEALVRLILSDPNLHRDHENHDNGDPEIVCCAYRAAALAALDSAGKDVP